jgi:hypothetical protein
VTSAASGLFVAVWILILSPEACPPLLWKGCIAMTTAQKQWRIEFFLALGNLLSPSGEKAGFNNLLSYNTLRKKQIILPMGRVRSTRRCTYCYSLAQWVRVLFTIRLTGSESLLQLLLTMQLWA